MGPAIENGFYYDFDLGQNKLSPESLKEIEVKMKKLIGGGVKFERKEIAIDEAKKIFRDQPFKLEIAADLEIQGEKEVSVYQAASLSICAAGRMRKRPMICRLTGSN
jgi:Threonyl-tRNA synthetase